MARKTPISFNLRKYVENHCNSRSECTAKQENKTSYTTDHTVPILIDFFGDDLKEIKTQTEKEIFIIVKNIVMTENWFIVGNLCGFPKSHTEK